MGFRENLKEELTYSGMLVKELAAKSGVNKRSIDSYLLGKGSVPSAEAAVKIAQVLGVSVEYLVTGREINRETILAPLNPRIRSLIHTLETLPERERRIVLKTAMSLAGDLKSP